ncbi:MAG: hypothetical protein K2M04_08840 [Muribaculaceae bacterium]|nr:hypothetical protein [Muribaculaceae bacterium]
MMINNILFRFIAAILTVAALTGCDSREAARGNLDAADVALNSADYQAARTYCDEAYKVLADTTQVSRATVDDLCRLALQYMTISDHADTDENVGAATRCLQLSLLVDRDSTLRYLAALPADHDSHAALLMSLQQSLEAPASEAEEEPDSLPARFIESMISESIPHEHGRR